MGSYLREIRLGVYGAQAREIVKRVSSLWIDMCHVGAQSDSEYTFHVGERNNAYYDVRYIFALSYTVAQDATGEVMFKANDVDSRTCYPKMSSYVYGLYDPEQFEKLYKRFVREEVAKWLATKAVDLADWIDNGKKFGTIRSEHARCLVDFLNGNDTSSYGKTVVKSVVGKCADPLQTEIKAAFNEETAKINDTFDARLGALQDEMRVKLWDAAAEYLEKKEAAEYVEKKKAADAWFILEHDRLRKERDEKKKAVLAERSKALAELRKSFR